MCPWKIENEKNVVRAASARCAEERGQPTSCWRSSLCCLVGLQILQFAKAFTSLSVNYCPIRPSSIVYDGTDCRHIVDYDVARYLPAKATKTHL